MCLDVAQIRFERKFVHLGHASEEEVSFGFNASYLEQKTTSIAILLDVSVLS